MADNSVNNSVERPQNKHLKPFKEGESGNPNGRPKGQRNYATIQAEAIKALGIKKNKTPEQIEEEIVQNGIVRAANGDYRFYKDILDRTHGTALNMQKVEHSGEVKVESAENFEELLKKAADLLKEKKTNAANKRASGSK